MPLPNLPIINGFVYSFASIELTAGALPLANNIKSITYPVESEFGIATARGGEPIGYTRGFPKPGDGTIVMLKAYGEAFMESLGDGYMSKIWAATINHRETGQTMITDTLSACRIMRVTPQINSDTSTDPQLLEFAIKILRVKLHGRDPMTGLVKFQ